MDKRYFYTVAGVITRKKGDDSTDITVWNAAVLATDDEMARMLTLGAMLEGYPMKDGWKDHIAFVRRIEPEMLAEWRAEEARS